MFKARVNFSGEADGNLSGPSHNIQEKMAANAAVFANPPITMAAFLATIDAWDLSLQKAEDRSRDHITAKNNARTDLEDDLRNLGGYVNTIAQGDLAKIELSGFPSYDTSPSTERRWRQFRASKCSPGAHSRLRRGNREVAG